MEYHSHLLTESVPEDAYELEAATEALAEELRRRVAGMGIHVFCYEDDFLIVGDDEAATQRGSEMA